MSRDTDRFLASLLYPLVVFLGPTWLLPPLWPLWLVIALALLFVIIVTTPTDEELIGPSAPTEWGRGEWGAGDAKMSDKPVPYSAPATDTDRLVTIAIGAAVYATPVLVVLYFAYR